MRLPKEFDGRIVWRDILTPVMDQKRCGACWAIVTTGVLAERFAIHSGEQIRVRLSPAKSILCDWGPEKRYAYPVLRASRANNDELERVNTEVFEEKKQVACSGSSLYDAWRYLLRFGVPEEHCVPFDLGRHIDIADITRNEQLPRCTEVLGPLMRDCIDGSPMQHYRAACMYEPKDSRGDVGTEEALMIDLLRFGPVSSGFLARQDFYDWNGRGVYRCSPKSPRRGAHAIEVVGYGENEEYGKYWICKNSWGTSWGYGGYFYIERNCERCRLEHHVVSTLPDIPNHRISQADVEQLWMSDDREIRDAWQLHESGYHRDDVKRAQEAGKSTKSLLPHDKVAALPSYLHLAAGDRSTWSLNRKNSPGNGNGGVVEWNGSHFRSELAREAERRKKQETLYYVFAALFVVIAAGALTRLFLLPKRR